MKISELLEKLINAGLVPADPHAAWEAFSEAVYTLDLQDQANFSDAATELFESHAVLLWSELGGEGSPNIDRPSVAIARSTKPSPRMAIDMSDQPAPLDCAGLQLMILDALTPITHADVAEFFEDITLHVESQRGRLHHLKTTLCEAITSQYDEQAMAIAAKFAPSK